MTGRKRLLYLCPVAMNLTGHWIERIRIAARQGYEVHIAVPDDPGLVGFDLGGATRHVLPLRRGLPSPRAELAYFMAIRSVIKAVRPDILHAITIRPVIYGGIAARLMKVPAAVFSVTGLGFIFGDAKLARVMRPFGEAAYRFVLHHPNCRVIFENPDDADLFVAERLVAREKTRVFVGGGIDLELYGYMPEQPAQEAEPVVILPGRLLAEKGVREFAEAARILKSRGRMARFALVGDVDPGNPGTLTRDQIEAWVREGVVEWWGWRNDMIEVIRQSSIVCLPTNYREGAPRSLIEAAAIGRAGVTTDVPGCRHVVVNEKTGLIVPARNPQALAAALDRLISDPSLRLGMGEAARHYAEAHFSTALAAERLLSVYAELSAPGGPPSHGI
ncbi:MAG: glycosyltransferase family 4 protein [Parvibaculaceae bacterium]|nr:glycosyltransferase family 4 protein [Parvibaculaceae bacterium]